MTRQALSVGAFVLTTILAAPLLIAQVESFAPIPGKKIDGPRQHLEIHNGRSPFPGSSTSVPTPLWTVRSSSTQRSTTSLDASAAAAVSAAGLPTLPTVALTCLLPSLLGFYKSEYGVSYAYGTAVATNAFLVLRSLSSPFSPLTVAACHASSVLFYGVRLNLLLLYRELFIPRFREFKERIEERAKERGNRLSRTPFILYCSALYFCMSMPLLVTGRLAADVPMFVKPSWVGKGLIGTALRSSVLLAWSGFLLTTLGDLTKMIGKARRGEDALITGGILRYIRHPNYTGEIIGWTSSCVAAFLAVAASGSSWVTYAPHLLAGVLGAGGIGFVLVMATEGLENRQREKYGDLDEYGEWVKSSWAGFRMGPKKSASTNETADGGEEEVTSVEEDGG